MKHNITLYCELCKLEINMPIEQFKKIDGGIALDNLKCINCQSKMKPDLTPITEFQCGRCHEMFEDDDEHIGGFIRLDEFGWSGGEDRLLEFMLCHECSENFRWWANLHSPLDRDLPPEYVRLE